LIAKSAEDFRQLAAQQLQATNTVLGLVPAGRGNDLARALGIPRNTRAAVATLLEGELRSIDLGTADGRVFVTVAACGFDALVSELVHRTRLPGGTSTYLLATLLALGRLRSARVRLEGDFGSLEQPAVLVATANTQCYGGGLRIAPSAQPDDGLLEVCVVGRLSRFELLRMLARVFKGKHVDHPALTMLRTGSLAIQSDSAWLLQADGERLGRTPARLAVLPSALRVMAPRGSG
jgi:diacylglycerol kinase (ATP)